jgi:hypothetical protein
MALGGFARVIVGTNPAYSQTYDAPSLPSTVPITGWSGEEHKGDSFIIETVNAPQPAERLSTD